MGRNCDKRVRNRAFEVLGILGIALILLGFSESDASAGFLKNGARPGSDRIQTVKPPRSGARKRIYKPGERQQAAKPKTSSGKRKRGQSYAWFWKLHTASATAASPSRWDQAIRTMADRRKAGQGITSQQTVAAVEIAYRSPIRAAASRHNVSDALLAAVIIVESRGQADAVSPKGAQGLMQLIPATAKRFGVTNSFDTGQNINGGAAYLSWLLKEFRGDPLLAHAGYNAGEGAVRKHKGVPPFSETRDYVVKVMDAVALIQARCKDGLATPRSRCEWRDELG